MEVVQSPKIDFPYQVDMKTSMENRSVIEVIKHGRNIIGLVDEDVTNDLIVKMLKERYRPNSVLLTLPASDPTNKSLYDLVIGYPSTPDEIEELWIKTRPGGRMALNFEHTTAGNQYVIADSILWAMENLQKIMYIGMASCAKKSEITRGDSKDAIKLTPFWLFRKYS